MRTPTLREVDVLSGALLAVLGLFITVQALGLGFYAGDVPGPGFFPAVLAIVLTVAGITLVVTRLRLAKRTGTERTATDEAAKAEAGTGESSTEAGTEEDAAGGDAPPPSRPYARPLALWAAIFVSSLLVGLIGFPIAMLGLTAVVLFVIERRRGIGAIVTTLAIPLLAWLLFAGLLQVPLPAGPFGI